MLVIPKLNSLRVVTGNFFGPNRENQRKIRDRTVAEAVRATITDGRDRDMPRSPKSAPSRPSYRAVGTCDTGQACNSRIARERRQQF